MRSMGCSFKLSYTLVDNLECPWNMNFLRETNMFSILVGKYGNDYSLYMTRPKDLSVNSMSCV